MTWCYVIHAEPGQRLLMRIAQIFDQQFLTPEELHWRATATSQVEITLYVGCEENLARRVHAKLFHLHDILGVELREATAEPAATSPSDASTL